MKRRILAGLLSTVIAATLLAGCGGQSASSGAVSSSGDAAAEQEATPAAETSQEATNKENIDNSGEMESISISVGDPGDLVPWTTGRDGKVIEYMLYEPLFDFESMGGDLYPVLADEDRGEFHGYDHEAGTNVYRVYLCDNIYDSAGNHMTASDIEFTIGIYQEKGATGRWSQYDHVEVIDDTTIDWYFTEELNIVGAMDTYFTALYFTQAAYEASADDFAVSACGTGPYELTAFTAGSSAQLTKRDDYWQKDESKIRQAHRANVKVINYSFITEPAQQLIALQTGSVDLVETVANDSLKPFLSGGEYANTYDVWTSRDNLNYMLSANCASDLAGDINFRLACFYAVDADGIVQALGDGAATRSYAVANTNFGDYYEEWNNMQWGDYDYEHVTDLELAKEYLEKSGYDGRTVEIITKNDSNNMAEIAQIVIAMLGQIGISANLTQYEAATWESVQDDVKAWDLSVDTWAGGSYTIASMNTYLGEFGFRNTHYDVIDTEHKLNEMIQDTRRIENHTKENMEAIQTEIFGNAYTMALLSKNRNTVYNKNKFSYLQMNYKLWVLPGGCTYITQ